MLCHDLRLKRVPRLLASEATETPLLIGIFRPTIVLPARLLETCTREELRLMLAHELAHVQRRDLLWGWLPLLTRLVCGFHPLVWLARRELSMAQEIACDEMALRLTGAASAEYGSLLVRVAAFCRPHPSRGFGMVGMTESYRTLKRRLSAMKNVPSAKPPYRVAISLILFTFSLGVIVPWRVSAQTTPPAPSALTPPPAVTTPPAALPPASVAPPAVTVPPVPAAADPTAPTPAPARRSSRNQKKPRTAADPAIAPVPLRSATPKARKGLSAPPVPAVTPADPFASPVTPPATRKSDALAPVSPSPSLTPADPTAPFAVPAPSRKAKRSGKKAPPTPAVPRPTADPFATPSASPQAPTTPPPAEGTTPPPPAASDPTREVPVLSHIPYLGHLFRISPPLPPATRGVPFLSDIPILGRLFRIEQVAPAAPSQPGGKTIRASKYLIHLEYVGPPTGKYARYFGTMHRFSGHPETEIVYSPNTVVILSVKAPPHSGPFVLSCILEESSVNAGQGKDGSDPLDKPYEAGFRPHSENVSTTEQNEIIYLEMPQNDDKHTFIFEG